MSAENKDLVRYIVNELFNCKRTELVSILYAPDCEGSCPDGPYSGREGFRAFFENYRSAFPDFQLDINYMVAEDDRVIVHYTFTGTSASLLQGRKVRIPGIMVNRIANNRIVEQSLIWDNLGPRRQIWLATVAERQMRPDPVAA